MSHSLTRIWIHAIVGTKNRHPLIKEPFTSAVYQHIEEKLNEIECKTRIINGTEDHIHALFLLSPKIAFSDVMKTIKGETSHWINQQDFTASKFAWQVGYGAFSVSESNVKHVQRYIENQKEHHKKLTFVEEYDLFMEKHGLLVNR